MSIEIIERIKKEIEGLEKDVPTLEVGTVISVGDGIAEIDGLTDAEMMEMVIFDDGEGKSLEETIACDDVLYGLILNLEEDSVKVVVLGESGRVKEGMTVKRTKKLLSIPVSEDIIGRVVNPLGEAIDGRGAIKGDKDMPKLLTKHW